MAIFRCKMCGGTIEFEQGATVGVCDSCGTKQTLPRLDDDKKANLYDRANHFRRNNEFDKAMAIYEQILNEDSTDAESYWSLVLCRYGIEYVEDPATRKRVPTVNRAQFTSIFDDEDYKSALQYADERQRAIYEQEAATINDIQKNILTISSQEDPFDVFICYKESDNSGRRTPDSVLATELYHELTREGYKVFFSRITLEDKLGTAYEPYIFAALNSARVMVVLGTKPEYFNAVWVRNEWSRYLALIKNGARKLLIPAYKDMDPYDLPEEFSHLQAQDMSKLGFMQDLIRGIGKVIGADTPQAPAKETVVMKNENGTVRAFLDRGFMALEDGEWDKADEFFEQALNFDAKIAEAYLGKLMAELRVHRQDELASLAEPFNDYNNYQKAIRFGNASLINTLEGYTDHINRRNEHQRLAKIYHNAKDGMKNAKREKDYLAIAATLDGIAEFEGAKELADECREKAEVCRKDSIYNAAVYRTTGCVVDAMNSYRTAIEQFESISGWRDADERAAACKQKLEEIKTAEKEKRIAAEKAAKRRKKFFAIVTPTVCACIVLVILLITVIVPALKYQMAINAIENGKIVEAYENLIALNGYKDSSEKAAEIFDQLNKEEKLKVAKVGDKLFFGAYEQDNDTSNGKEAIEWLVLANEGDKALVISRYILDCQPYNTSKTSVTWETCSLRKWLNETFVSNAFSADEQNRILNTTVTGDENPKYNTSPGNNTTDKVFLLSIAEVNEYFSANDARKCTPTAYVIQGVYTGSSYTADGEAIGWWWLRSSGSYQHRAANVNNVGTIYYTGSSVTTAGGGVRPAMWIDISKIQEQ